MLAVHPLVSLRSGFSNDIASRSPRLRLACAMMLLVPALL